MRVLPTRPPSRSANSSGYGDQGAALGAEVLELREHPRRRPAQRVLPGELDPRPADVLVRVVDVDVAGAPEIGVARDGAGERRVLRQRRDPDVLPRADVGADLDCKLCIAIEPFLGRHRPKRTVATFLAR
jgi:hypothetical protein